MAERITGKTKLIGLLASPISHSMSPTMHNEAFAHLGLDYVYLAFDCGADALEQAIIGLRTLAVRGFNVSMPNKTIVHRYLDKVEPNAALSGSVNTVVNDGGVLTGHNTDGIGFIWAMAKNGVDIIGKKMTVIGAGGAAGTICIQAAMDGVAELAIFNRKDAFFSVGEKTVWDISGNTNCRARLFDIADTEELRAQLSDSVLLTDATTVGMGALEHLCNIPDPSMLRPDLIVADVVYSPRKTKLLEMAENRGCEWYNGLGMMIGQGAESFRLWTDVQMPVEHVEQFIN